MTKTSLALGLAALVVVGCGDRAQPEEALHVRTLDELCQTDWRTLKGVPDRPVEVDGYHRAGSGGGRFLLDRSNTSPTNLATIFAAVPQGRWVRVVTEDRLSALECGATGDGVTDDTLALRALFASGVPRLRIDADHAFLISNTVRMTNDNTTIEWFGRVKAADNVQYNQFVFGVEPEFRDGAPQLTRSNLVIQGNGSGGFDGNSHHAAEYFPTGSKAVHGGHGLWLRGYRGVKMDHLKIQDVVNFAVAIQACADVTVTGCDISTGRGTHSRRFNGKNADGIHLIDVEHVLIASNHVFSTDDSVAVTCQRGYCKDIAIRDNHLEHSLLVTDGYAPLGYNIRLTTSEGKDWSVSDVTVENNDLSGGNGAATLQNLRGRPDQTRHVIFRNNIIHNKTEPGVPGYVAANALIVNNASDVHFTSNRFENLARVILYVQNANDLTFTGNKITGLQRNPLMKAQPVVLLDSHNATEGGRNIVVEDNEVESTEKNLVVINRPKEEGRVRYENVRDTRNRRTGPGEAHRPERR